MILHPTVIANLLSSSVATGMVVYAAYYGAEILKHWDLQSGSELQLVLERKTYLISTILSYVFGLQLLSLFLFIFTADSLTPLFVGAMCAAGTLNINAFGYPTLVLKIINFILAGLWLVLNYADNLGYDYPLIKKKYRLLIAVAPLIVLEAVLESAYFFGMRADVITSCCGSLFSSDKPEDLGSEIASLPSIPMMWAFYVTMTITLFFGLYSYIRGNSNYIYPILSVLSFLIALASVISFISLYIYELPTHHCPFCIIMEDYSYVGYLLYTLLLGAVVFGISAGALLPYQSLQSLKEILPSLIAKLTFVSVFFFLIFTTIVSYQIVFSNLIM